MNTNAHDRQRQRPAPTLAAMALAFACGAAAAQVPSAAPPMAQGETGGEPNWRFDIGARLQLDHDSFQGVYSRRGGRASDGYVRRARIELAARAFEVWKFGLDIAPLEDGAAILDSAVVAYSGFDALTISAGRFKPDFSLEEATSSKWVTGIERSAIWDLAPDAAERDGSWGLEVRTHGAHHHASAGLFNKPDARAQALRVAYAPLLQPGRVLHLGASLSREGIDASDGRIRTRLGVRGVTEDDRGQRATLARKVDGGFDSDRAGVLEFAFAHGPWSLQAEALQRRLGGAGGQASRTARGQYVQLAWTLTGEPRPYDIDGAKFKELRPTGPYGAWELFYRHDRLRVDSDAAADLLDDDDRRRTGARVDVLGLNWYARRNLRLSLNHLWTRTHGPFNDAGDDDGRALSLRVQLLL